MPGLTPVASTSPKSRFPKIPYAILARRAFEANGRNPLIIEAYGSYGYSMTPSYRSQMIPFLNRGGIYVAASVRGGGAFGRKWHYAGKAENKANTWRDSIDGIGSTRRQLDQVWTDIFSFALWQSGKEDFGPEE